MDKNSEKIFSDSIKAMQDLIKLMDNLSPEDQDRLSEQGNSYVWLVNIIF